MEVEDRRSRRQCATICPYDVQRHALPRGQPMFVFEYTPLIWPFVVSLIITSGLGLYAYRRRHIRAVSIFGLLMVTMSIWTFFYIMGLSSATLQGKIFWDSVK